MSDEQFKDFFKEVIPLIEQMIEISKKYVPDDKLCAVSFAGDGYFTFNTLAGDLSVSRIGAEEKMYFKRTEVFNAGTD